MSTQSIQSIQYTWKQYDTVYYRVPADPVDLSKVEKAAIFDLDWTLVKPATSKFPKNAQDNVIMNNRIPLLRKYQELGYLIVVISNQKLTQREILSDKIARMNDVITKFGAHSIDLLILMATQDDEYRKPGVGMYKLLFQLVPNIKTGFYCGDAAGRPNDFSDSDLKFAEGTRLTFYTPEQIFGV